MDLKLQDLAVQLTPSINSPTKLKYCNAFGFLQIILGGFFLLHFHHLQPESPSQRKGGFGKTVINELTGGRAPILSSQCQRMVIAKGCGE